MKPPHSARILQDPCVPRVGERPFETSLTLLDLAKRGDEQAWNRVIELYMPLVFRWLSRAPDSDRADLGQEIFMKVFPRLPAFQRQRSGSFRRWLRQIAENALTDLFRRRGKEPTYDRVDMETLPEPAAVARDGFSQEQAILHSRAIQLLDEQVSDEHRQIFLATFVDGRPARDVAEEFGTSSNNVYTIRFRVLEKLRAEFGVLLD